jgi:hypothetical protein
MHAPKERSRVVTIKRDETALIEIVGATNMNWRGRWVRSSWTRREFATVLAQNEWRFVILGSKKE